MNYSLRTKRLTFKGSLKGHVQDCEEVCDTYISPDGEVIELYWKSLNGNIYAIVGVISSYNNLPTIVQIVPNPFLAIPTWPLWDLPRRPTALVHRPWTKIIWFWSGFRREIMVPGASFPPHFSWIWINLLGFFGERSIAIHCLTRTRGSGDQPLACEPRTGCGRNLRRMWWSCPSIQLNRIEH